MLALTFVLTSGLAPFRTENSATSHFSLGHAQYKASVASYDGRK
jgi:hypothetical protein